MNRRNILILVAMLLFSLSLAWACEFGSSTTVPDTASTSSVNRSPQPRPPRLNLHVERLRVGAFAIRVRVPGPPYPSHVHVKWQAPPSNKVQSAQPSHSQYVAFKWKGYLQRA
jgi:hypothetical protein